MYTGGMDAGHVVLLVVLVGAVSAMVWALMGRAALAAGAAAEGEASRRAAEELERARGEAERLRAEMVAQARALAHVEADLKSAQIEHEAILKTRDAVMGEQMKAVELRERQLREQVEQLQTRMQETFRSLAAGALKESTSEFLKLAGERFTAQRAESANELEQRKAAVEQLVKPIAETLAKTQAKLGEIDTARAATAAALSQQMQGVVEMGSALKGETAKLVNALKRPEVRGRYGEIQLKRVAELAGMTAYCDFEEQMAVRDGDGRLRRPDMIVKLPNERMVAVDAKCNIDAYIKAAETGDDGERERLLAKFAEDVCEQVAKLSGKSYWSRLERSPEFVVMFVPGDQFLDAALSRCDGLLEKAAEARVILASPSTLIGLLRAVAVGWHEKQVEAQARELLDLGRQLHERASVVSDHLSKLGRSLDQAVGKYNDLVGSYEGRLEPTLRRFEEAGAKSGKQLAEVESVTVRARLPAGDERIGIEQEL